MFCPICSFEVSCKKGLASHFRHQSATHPNYTEWATAEKWKHKKEGSDFVTCLECGHKAETLARHLLSEHKITAGEYKEKWGTSVLIRCEKTKEKRVAAIKDRSGGFGKGDTKKITCPTCGEDHEASKFFSYKIHDPNCDSCKEKLKYKKESDRWEGLSESTDFVTCLECGHRAENLTSHVINMHPDYREKYPNALMNSLNSGVRNKEYQVGKKHTEETKHRMSVNAGKWNIGLTKETDIRVEKISEKLMGNISWNKGLTSKSHTSIAETVRKLKLIDHTWESSLKVNLTLEDFIPFMDSDGKVDHLAIIERTGISWVTIHRYIKELSLEKTRKYIKERADKATVHIDKEKLLEYSLKNGKIYIGRAMVGLGYSFKIIKRECKRHGLKTFTRSIRQALCLDNVAKALGISDYKSEWQNSRFKNPKTGYRFKYDGFFEEIGLIVEFQGHQHYIYPNIYLKTEDEYNDLRERDRIKEEMILNDPNLIFFKIREDEPFDNIDYIKGRLFSEGILKMEQL